MRFLVDENLSHRVCDRLNAAGHDAAHVRDAGMHGATDRQVLTMAVTDERVLITADRGDFGRELAQTRATEPSVFLLRQLPDVVRADEVAALVLANLTHQITSAITKGAFVVLSPKAVRVRYLPLR
ncbi:MAG: hypothetical protein GEU83_18705 [Pseudonocardiaceae bacterium]|nr:hypothetical protein [Pseudonocardiaceae bacterium]